MFSPLLLLVAILLYVGLLFALAQWARRHEFKGSPLVYSLSLAVYCTSWTFYGSVGSAANSGIEFMAIYLGPTLALLFAGTLLRKMVRIKSRYHVTSIADLISTRYSKSQGVAVLVTLVCLIGILPYIALQLKAIITTFNLMVVQPADGMSVTAIDIGLVTVVLMTLFTILFGVRHLDPTERHQGMMVALAAESLVKLVAFLLAGLFITYGLFDGVGDLLNRVEQLDHAQRPLAQLGAMPPISTWITLIVLAMSAFVFLPRQFHVAVVENGNEHHLKTAQWLLPTYLLVINLFVLPVAMGGLLLGHPTEQADTFLLLLPLEAGETLLSLLVFIGGFSAATGMILVSAMTLSTMITNHLLLPLIEVVNWLQPLRRHLLQLRWLAVALFIFSGYLVNHLIGDSFMLINMGLISFAAILQFAPPIIGGLYWRSGNVRGAMAGLAAGFLVWGYTLLLPALIESGWWSAEWLEEGPWGIALLNPQTLLGLSLFEPLPHAVFWSLTLNIGCYVAVSLLLNSSNEERALANEFVDIMTLEKHPLPDLGQQENIPLDPKLDFLKECFTNYMPVPVAEAAIARCLTESGLAGRQQVTLLEATHLCSEAEKLLGGALGGAIAHRVVQRSGVFTHEEEQQLSHQYSDLLAEIHLTPDELWRKIDYYQEREQLLGENAETLQQTVERLEEEAKQRRSAEEALQQLNNRLEEKVEARTAELLQSNSHLTQTLQQLQQTQSQLVEADKMAALGRLVAGVAHEINTPLGVAIGSSSLIGDDVASLAQEYRDESLTDTMFEELLVRLGESARLNQSNLEKVAQLVRSFKQLAVEQHDHATTEIHLVTMVDSVLSAIRTENEQRQVTLSNRVAPAIRLHSHPADLSLVLISLIRNSLQHGYRQGQPGEIVISAERLNDDRVDLRVCDDGSGIAEDIAGQVFEPFFTTKRNEGGSGLGLHIVYNIVTQKLKGRIVLERDTTSGCCFSITLPIEPD